MTALLDDPAAEAFGGEARSSRVLPHTILGTGIGVPRTIVTNDDLAEHLDTNDEWIRSRTGIRERRFLDDSQSTSDLCIQAAEQALRTSDVPGHRIDAVVLATLTPDQPIPSTALMVMEAIGAHRAIPIDLNQAACAGGVLGMLVGIHLLCNDSIEHVLVIGGEALTRVTDPLDRSTRVFFGDAAGAVVLGRSQRPDHGLLAMDVEAALSYSVEVPGGGATRPATAETVEDRQHFIKMDGRAVWEKATQSLPKSIEQAVARAGVDLQEVSHYVIHQANRKIVEEVMDRLGVERERAGVTVDWLGNTGGATVFTVLHEAVSSKKVQRGDIVVVAGIGAGFICGSLVIRYG